MATFRQDMEERNTSGRLLSQDPTTPSLTTEANEASDDCQKDVPSCHLQLQILFWLILVIAVVGIVGNVAVFWLLRFCMRRNPFLVYILKLSVADFITLYKFITDKVLEKISPSICKNLLFEYFSNIVTMCSMITGLSMLSAISTERCLSTLWPIWYRCRRPKHTSAVTCGLLWALALLWSILEECACNDQLPNIDPWCVPLDFFIATYLIALFVLLSASSLALVLRIFCGSHRIRMTSLCVTILLTVLFFLFCGLPFVIYYFILYWFKNDVASVLPCYYQTLSVFLSCVNSSANPIIYFFVGSFRQRKLQSLKQVLQRALQDTPETDDPGSSPQETLERSGSRVGQG